MCCSQACANAGQQMPMPLPAGSMGSTNVHLRPQLDQYNDMAKFLGYSAGSSSLPSSSQDRSNHSHASSQSAFLANPSTQSQSADQTTSQPAPMELNGLYPNDHAVDLPTSRPYQTASARALDNPWEPLQGRASSKSSTSTSSTSSCSSHRHPAQHPERQPQRHSRHSRRQPERQAERLPDRQADRQAEGQAERQADRQAKRQPHRQAERQPDQEPERQFQMPAAQVAASPFMADAQHSYAPVNAFRSPFITDAEHSFAPVSAFKSPFMADAEHSFVPPPVIAQQQAPDAWEAFGSPTFPSQAPTNVHNQYLNQSSTQSPAVHPNGDTAVTPPTDYFSYLDLLGPGQAADPQTTSQQPYQIHLSQQAQPQTRSHHGQHRQQRAHDRQQHESHRHEHDDEHQQQQQQKHRQQRHQHQEGRSQHRQDRHQHRQERDQHLQERQQQHQPQASSRASSYGQAAGPPHPGQPRGTDSDPLPGVKLGARSAFDSFDTFPSGNISL